MTTMEIKKINKKDLLQGLFFIVCLISFYKVYVSEKFELPVLFFTIKTLFEVEPTVTSPLCSAGCVVIPLVNVGTFLGHV